jgi:hypothetical protein
MIRSSSLILLLLALLPFQLKCNAQNRLHLLDGSTITPAELDASLEEQMQALAIPGLPIAVRRSCPAWPADCRWKPGV